jgi:hypothetical protein
MRPSARLIEAIGVVCELTDTALSKPAAAVMAKDLASYPEQQVLAALDRCRRELRTRLTPAEVIARLDDGRPGPEEAWSMLPRSEADSVVWTEEMSKAFGVASPLLSDPVQARMAFLERYRELVRQARERAVPVRWIPSLGTDHRGQEAALLTAAEAGRIGSQRANELLPFSAGTDVVARLEAMGEIKLLEKAA